MLGGVVSKSGKTFIIPVHSPSIQLRHQKYHFSEVRIMLQSKAYNRPTYQRVKPSLDKSATPEETEIGD